MIWRYDIVIANNKSNTIPAAGNAYQVAAADKINSAVVICSVPYATDDNASEESKAKALNLVKDCPLSSAVLMLSDQYLLNIDT